VWKGKRRVEIGERWEGCPIRRVYSIKPGADEVANTSRGKRMMIGRGGDGEGVGEEVERGY
jgi:hypothetical protein